MALRNQPDLTGDPAIREDDREDLKSQVSVFELQFRLRTPVVLAEDLNSGKIRDRTCYYWQDKPAWNNQVRKASGIVFGSNMPFIEYVGIQELVPVSRKRCGHPGVGVRVSFVWVLRLLPRRRP
jgi:hypothetical protein